MLDKLDLVVEIEELLEECNNYPFGDFDGQYPCELITSPFVENGEFTIENFLLWQEFIELSTWEELVSDLEIDIVVYEDDYPELIEQYQDFLDFIPNNLQNIQVYKIKLERIDEGSEEEGLSDAFCLIGSIDNNYWVGLTTKMYNEYYNGLSAQRYSVELPKKAREIVSRLKQDFKESIDLLNKLVDYFDDGYKVEVIDDRSLIIEKLLDSACYFWSTEFKPSSKYRIGNQLTRLLTDNLLDVKQYKIWGYDGLFIYIGGTTEDGDWIGIYTREEYSY